MLDATLKMPLGFTFITFSSVPLKYLNNLHNLVQSSQVGPLTLVHKKEWPK